jgi:hypothetical protein
MPVDIYPINGATSAEDECTFQQLRRSTIWNEFRRENFREHRSNMSACDNQLNFSFLEYVRNLESLILKTSCFRENSRHFHGNDTLRKPGKVLCLANSFKNEMCHISFP